MIRFVVLDLFAVLGSIGAAAGTVNYFIRQRKASERCQVTFVGGDLDGVSKKVKITPIYSYKTAKMPATAIYKYRGDFIYEFDEYVEGVDWNA